MLRKKGRAASIVLTAASSHMGGEDGEQNEKKGNGRFDCCQVAAAAWCFLFNTLLESARE